MRLSSWSDLNVSESNADEDEEFNFFFFFSIKGNLILTPAQKPRPDGMFQEEFDEIHHNEIEWLASNQKLFHGPNLEMELEDGHGLDFIRGLMEANEYGKRLRPHLDKVLLLMRHSKVLLNARGSLLGRRWRDSVAEFMTTRVKSRASTTAGLRLLRSRSARSRSGDRTGIYPTLPLHAVPQIGPPMLPDVQTSLHHSRLVQRSQQPGHTAPVQGEQLLGAIQAFLRNFLLARANEWAEGHCPLFGAGHPPA